MTTEIKNLKKAYGYTSLVLFFWCAIVVGIPYWIHVKGGKNIGLFASSGANDDGTYKTECTPDLSEMECGTLQSAKISAVISIIFGGFATITYLLPPPLFASLPTFIALVMSCLQMIFSIMSGVLWYYFKNRYYDDDGINREYDTEGASDMTFDAAFYMWIIGSFASIVITFSGFYALFKFGKDLDVEDSKA